MSGVTHARAPLDQLNTIDVIHEVVSARRARVSEESFLVPDYGRRRGVECMQIRLANILSANGSDYGERGGNFKSACGEAGIIYGLREK